jgi:cellulose 1,4-beta-cellobiosidase
VHVTDDDVQQIMVSSSALVVPESGNQTFAVTLAFQPQSNVSVMVESGDPDAATAGSATLVFTPEDWNTPQVVTVSGVDDVDTSDEFLNVDLTSPGITGVSVALHVDDDDDTP